MKKRGEEEIKIKQLTPPKEKALVYIVRPTIFGFAMTFDVECDGVNIGKTRGKNFIYAILDPGEHIFISKSENKSELKLNLEAGKTYFLEQKVKTGVRKPRNELTQIDENEGRKKLEKCSLRKK